MAGIFGDTPSSVRQQMMAEQLGQANMIGNLGFGGRGALAGLQAGQGIGGILGAPEDPRLAQAQKMQMLEQEAAQAGLEPGTPEFTQWVVPRVTAAAGQQAGIQAFQMASQLEAQRLELEGIRGAPQAGQAQMEARARHLISLGEPPEAALTVATNDDVYRDRVKELTKDRSSPEKRLFQDMQATPGLRDSVIALRRAGANVTKINIDRPMSLGDLQKVRGPDGQPLPPGTTAAQAAAAVQAGAATVLTPEQQAAATKQATADVANTAESKELTTAGERALQVVQGISLSSVISPRQRGQWGIVMGRLAKAAAQKRNPGDAEAAADAERRLLDDLPGIAFAAAQPEDAKSLIREIMREAGTGAGPKRRRFNPATGQLE